MPDDLAVALANFRAAWRALDMIRAAVEELAPPGTVTAREQLDPEPEREAEVLVRGIEAIARRGGKHSRIPLSDTWNRRTR